MSDWYGFNPDLIRPPNTHYPPPTAPPFHQYPVGHQFPPNTHQPGNIHQAPGCYWVPCSAYSQMPPHAVVGGNDQDGSTIFVGRAYHENEWLPAKVIPAKNIAYVSHAGREFSKSEFQVLCEQRFEWFPSSDGSVPPNAVEGGKTSDGERLYIGRVHHGGALTVGKVHPSHGVLYIPFGGREISHSSYEVLVLM